MPSRYVGLGPSRARTGFLRLVNQDKWYRFAGSTLPGTITTFLVSFASLFYWKCLATSSSPFLHAAINARLPPGTVSTHTLPPTPSLFCPLQCQTHSLFFLSTQSIHFLLPTLSSPLCTLKVSDHYSLWQPPAAHSDERPRMVYTYDMTWTNGVQSQLFTTFAPSLQQSKKLIIIAVHPDCSVGAGTWKLQGDSAFLRVPADTFVEVVVSLPCPILSGTGFFPSNRREPRLPRLSAGVISGHNDDCITSIGIFFLQRLEKSASHLPVMATIRRPILLHLA